MKVTIEEMDESESIVAFSRRLPLLRLQQRNGRDRDSACAHTAALVRGGSSGSGSGSPPRSVQEVRGGLLTARAITAPVAGIRPMLGRLLSAPTAEGNVGARRSRAMPIAFGGGVLFGEGRQYGASVGCQQQN